VCAFLGPEEIPRELFEQQLDPPAADLDLFADDPFALDDAVAALRRFGLVKAEAQLLAVHRLLQQVVAEALDPGRKAARVGAAVRLLDKALPFGGWDDPGLWPACARLLPHALAAIEHAIQLGVEPLATASLLESAADYLRGRARYADARPLYERALAIHEARAGFDHPDTARSLNGLANVLRDQGDQAGARALLERALAIREARLGPDHLDTAHSLNNLAGVLVDEGDLDRARALYERALAIREARLAPTTQTPPGA
jgi:tetratricopeptide (TPR) repeat protein